MKTINDTHISEAQARPLFELVGTLPFSLIFLAILIGVSCLVIRRKSWIQSALILEISIALLGFSITFWRLFSSNIIYADGGAPDPSSWFFNFATSWTAAAATLTGVAGGLFLIAISWLFKRKPERAE